MSEGIKLNLRGSGMGKCRRKYRGANAMDRKALITASSALTLVAVVVGIGVLSGHQSPACAATVKTSFKEDVYPIFRGRCIDCHHPGGQGYEVSGLDLSTYEGVMQGTKYGPIVIPGDPDMSNLLWLLDWKASPKLRMPHGKKKLSTCDRDAIRHWIKEGAKNN
jgi:hypothetical protein